MGEELHANNGCWSVKEIESDRIQEVIIGDNKLFGII